MTDYIPSIFEFTNPSGQKVFKIEAVVGTKNGKRVRTRRTAKNLSDAKRIRSELISLAAKGELTAKSTTRINDYAKYFVENTKRGRIKDSTLADYQARLQRHVLPYLGQLTLGSIRAADIQRWMMLLKNAGYAVATINSARRLLHSVLQQAIREELIYRNPVELTDPYRKQAGEKTSVQPAWSKEEALAALRAARDSEFDLFLNIALFTGMRRGEILGLIWDEVDIHKAEISITGTLKELRKVLPSGQAVVVLKKDSPKTQASKRTVGLPWPVAQAIMRHREFQKLRQLENPNWQQSEYVFTSSTGTAVYPSNFLSRFKKFLAAAGLRQIRIHDLRHTMAQLALSGGVRIEAVSETLGHTRIDTTKTIYASRVSQLAIDAPHQLAELLIDFEGEFGLSPEIEITQRKSPNNLDGA